LAEDDVLARNLMRHGLERAGFLVFAAANGFEAIELSQAVPGRIDVLLADMDMPHWSGISLAWQVKGERPETLIVMMSDRAQNVMKSDGMVFLPKINEPALILRMLEDLFGARANH